MEAHGFDWGPVYFRETDLSYLNGATIDETLGSIDVQRGALVIVQAYLKLDDPVAVDISVLCNGVVVATCDDAADIWNSGVQTKTAGELSGVATTATPDETVTLEFTLESAAAIGEAATVEEATVAVLVFEPPTE